jgi:arsenite methyltransferase
MSATPETRPAPRSGCCEPTTIAGPAGAAMPSDAAPDEVRAVVRENYGSIAEGRTEGCGCGCGPAAGDVLEQIGYAEAQKAAIPEGANLGLGCGNPVAHAAIRPGETVLDLGSGGGIDCFLAARETGPSGRVIGVDMTPAMLDRARAATQKGGYANVEFRLGEIEHLPVADATVDVIISNCVINLSPDKPQVFREALRALKPGGRLVVSDLVLLKPLPEPLRASVELYVGCVAGASLREDYLRMMREAGFDDVSVVEERGYTVGADALPPESAERAAFDAVVSAKVRGVKRA